MFTIRLPRNIVQSAACMLLAMMIVAGGLMAGALGAQALERDAIAALERKV